MRFFIFPLILCASTVKTAFSDTCPECYGGDIGYDNHGCDVGFLCVNGPEKDFCITNPGCVLPDQVNVAGTKCPTCKYNPNGPSTDSSCREEDGKICARIWMPVGYGTKDLCIDKLKCVVP